MKKFLLIVFIAFIAISCNQNKKYNQKITETTASEQKKTPQVKEETEPNPDWYGFFYMENYPVENCTIKKLDSNIKEITSFIASQREKFKDERNFTSKYSEYISDLENSMKMTAINKGYNSIVGAKIEHNISYHGTEGLTSVNGSIGYGIGTIMIIGHPAIINCSK